MHAQRIHMHAKCKDVHAKYMPQCLLRAVFDGQLLRPPSSFRSHFVRPPASLSSLSRTFPMEVPHSSSRKPVGQVVIRSQYLSVSCQKGVCGGGAPPADQFARFRGARSLAQDMQAHRNIEKEMEIKCFLKGPLCVSQFLRASEQHKQT